jgi:hypothetical protein
MPDEDAPLSLLKAAAPLKHVLLLVAVVRAGQLPQPAGQVRADAEVKTRAGCGGFECDCGSAGFVVNVYPRKSR